MRTHLVMSGIVIGIAGSISCLLLTMPAHAAQRKACMQDHFHYGSSSGHPSKQAARAEAIRSWIDFTAFEYGDAWGSFKLARSKGIQCRRKDDGWGCNIEAVPCR